MNYADCQRIKGRSHTWTRVPDGPAYECNVCQVAYACDDPELLWRLHTATVYGPWARLTRFLVRRLQP